MKTGDHFEVTESFFIEVGSLLVKTKIGDTGMITHVEPSGDFASVTFTGNSVYYSVVAMKILNSNCVRVSVSVRIPVPSSLTKWLKETRAAK